jgi:hypothetical protein
MSMEWMSVVGGGFILATVFWAGSTYNRISAIEAAITDIKNSIPALGDLAVLRVEMDALKERVRHLEEL